jgi:hypothetical protein
VHSRELVGDLQHGTQVERALLLHVAFRIAPLHAVLAGGR